MACKTQHEYEKELMKLKDEIADWKISALRYKWDSDKYRELCLKEKESKVDVYKKLYEKDKYIRALESEVQEVRIWLAERDLSGPHQDLNDTEFFEKA